MNELKARKNVKREKNETGNRTLNIVLAKQGRYQGINNNEPVDVIYRINFRPENAKIGGRSDSKRWGKGSKGCIN